MVAFTLATTLISEPAFCPEDVVAGVRPAVEWRNAPGRIWVEVGRQEECLRVYGMSATTPYKPPVVFLEGDVIDRGNRFAGNVTIREGYRFQTPYLMQAEAEQIASIAERMFINLARPGVFGSSGDHNERRREREVALVDAALDRLKVAFGWTCIHLAGLSGGGHLVAALMARRSDIDHAVIASGNTAVGLRNKIQGRAADATGYTDFVDPIGEVAKVAEHPPRQITVLTDPDDAVVPAECQIAYVRALQQQGVNVKQRFVPATDARHHILRFAALLAATCSV